MKKKRPGTFNLFTILIRHCCLIKKDFFFEQDIQNVKDRKRKLLNFDPLQILTLIKV